MTEQHHLRGALHAAETELSTLRQRLAQVVAFINDPAHDSTARTALAQHLGLPAPRQENQPHGR